MTEAQQATLDIFRAHVARIQAMLETPRGEDFDMLYWRAVYFGNDDALRVAGLFIREQSVTKPGEGTAVFEVRQAYIARPAGYSDNGVQLIQSPLLSAEEIAIFLGLQDIDYDALVWKQVVDPVKARAEAIGIDMRRGPQIVTPGRAGYH